MSDINTSKVDGNTVSASEFNQLAEINNLISTSGQTPSTTNTQQISIGSARYSSAGQFYTDGGTANAYVLSPVSPFKSPVSATAGEGYFNGMIICFRAGNANTGASTVNVNGAGVKNLLKQDGTALSAGDISSDSDVEFRYNGTSFLRVLGKATTTTQGISYLLPNRNILINGAMAIDQRNAGASQTITAGSALAYTVDRWYAYCTGADATGQRVAGTAPNQYNYRFTGASSVSKIGFAQRIEASNCQHLAGKTATLSVDLANSVLTTVSWTAWYANTADTFGTLASPTRTQIATGTFTVNSTLTRYATSIAIPAGATTGIEIEFSVGAQTSGTWTIGRAQLEDTPEQTTFEYRTIQQELSLCERYFKKTFALETAPANNAGLANAICHRNPSVTNNNFSENWDLNMRATPSITTYNPSSGTSGYWYTDDNATSIASAIEVNLSAKRATISHLGVSGIANYDYYIHATATAEL